MSGLPYSRQRGMLALVGGSLSSVLFPRKNLETQRAQRKAAENAEQGLRGREEEFQERCENRLSGYDFLTLEGCSGVQVADRDGESIGGIGGLGRLGQVEQPGHHVLNLVLLRPAIAYDG
jgi:hypothetical protein